MKVIMQGTLHPADGVTPTRFEIVDGDDITVKLWSGTSGELLDEDAFSNVEDALLWLADHRDW